MSGPQKICPKCNNKVHVKVKICKNETCGFIFTKKDKDDEDDEDDEDEIEIPERSCSVCDEKFSPKLSKKTVLGEPIWIWMYENYCSAACFENGENKLFNFIYGLLYSSEKIKHTQNPSEINTFEKILATEVFSYNGSPEIEVPNDIIKIVNPENFVLRKTGGNNVDSASFIKLTSPRFPVKRNENESEKNESKPLNINTSKEFDSTFDRPPPKKITPIEEKYSDSSLEKKVADHLDLPLGDYVDKFLDKPENSIAVKKDLKPGKGKRLCPSCGAIVSGGRAKSCTECGEFFPKKE